MVGTSDEQQRLKAQAAGQTGWDVVGMDRRVVSTGLQRRDAVRAGCPRGKYA